MKWSNKQTAATIRYGSEAEGSVVEERLVEQHVDSGKDDGPNFYLYYFAKDFTFLLDNRGINQPNIVNRTILFMSGGPGEVNRPGNANFGDLAGYRIVYFHLRGAGFSQLPTSNYFDRFLRTRYAVDDIEKIRKDLLGDEPWAGIIAHSYGTVLAQQYAHKYGTEKLLKLVLSAPLSRHTATSETVQFRSLRKIYEAKYFDSLRELIPGIGDIVAPKAENISRKAEEEFGSVNFLAEVYGNSLIEPEEGRKFQAFLRDKKLDYSLGFFKALRRLRLTGWLPHDEDLAKGASENVDTVQQLAGLLIAIEILEKEPESYDVTKMKQCLADLTRRPSASAISKKFAGQFADAEAYFKAGLVNTPRVFYVVSIYDGINETFLEKALDEKSDLKSAINALGGKQARLNKSLCKIALENDAIKRWDPKQFIHNVPTLILEGDADPITENGQADYVFKEALSGDRVLIRFPGIGHSMSLPRMNEKLNTRDYLLQNFLSGDFDDLKTVVVPKVRRVFSDLLEQESHKRFKPLEVQAKYISRSGDNLIL